MFAQCATAIKMLNLDVLLEHTTREATHTYDTGIPQAQNTCFLHLLFYPF